MTLYSHVLHALRRPVQAALLAPGDGRALLRGFVHEDGVAQVDFSTLEKTNGHYVSEELLQRSDDILCACA